MNRNALNLEYYENNRNSGLGTSDFPYLNTNSHQYYGFETGANGFNKATNREMKYAIECQRLKNWKELQRFVSFVAGPGGYA
jgi:hypothetical protein